MTEKFANVTVLNHPLIQTKVGILRNVSTSNQVFRSTLNEVASLMVYEVFRDFPVKELEIRTPLEKVNVKQLSRGITLVPILRAGLGMTDGILQLIPEAKVGHIGLYRDKKTLEPVEYYSKFPSNLSETEVVVIDPMLATGGSACTAIDFIKKSGGKNIRFVCLVAAPEGIIKMTDLHPDVPIFTAAMDRELNDHAYILPGLGDAGDRIYGTE